MASLLSPLDTQKKILPFPQKKQQKIDSFGYCPCIKDPAVQTSIRQSMRDQWFWKIFMLPYRKYATHTRMDNYIVFLLKLMLERFFFCFFFEVSIPHFGFSLALDFLVD